VRSLLIPFYFYMRNFLSKVEAVGINKLSERESIYHFHYSKNLRFRNKPPFVYNICIYIFSFFFLFISMHSS
jgi:hypothetical protein